MRRWLVLATTPVLTTFGGVTVIAIVVSLTNAACRAAASSAPPSAAAQHSIPTSLLAIYQQVGQQYDLPWQILAGIGQEECDQGRNRDPSCTIQPGATGPGAANAAGASGPMQIGIGGAAGDAYDQYRHDLPDPHLGPHDPTTAVELAALVLIKGKGAPTGAPIDAYRAAVAAYNGTGAAAAAYASRVLADAASYGGGVLTATGGGGCADAATFAGPLELTPGPTAHIITSTGDATAPMDAPVRVQEAIAAGNAIHTLPYPSPDVHYGSLTHLWPAYDCSGAVSYVLFRAGLNRANADVSGALEQWGLPGPGKWITIYARPGHTWIAIAGIAFDTADYGGPNVPPGSGPRWRANPTSNLADGYSYVVRHPAGL